MEEEQLLDGNCCCCCLLLLIVKRNEVELEVAAQEEVLEVSGLTSLLLELVVAQEVCAVNEVIVQVFKELL